MLETSRGKNMMDWRVLVLIIKYFSNGLLILLRGFWIIRRTPWNIPPLLFPALLPLIFLVPHRVLILILLFSRSLNFLLFIL